MMDFRFVRPTSVADAVSTLKKSGEGRLLAGGQSLIPMLKLGLASYAELVTLAGIAELRGIKKEGDRLVIGATTTHAEVEASDVVRAAIPALAGLAGGIGDPHVRNRGTLGGSLAHNDPAADYPAAVLGLGATIHTDRRTIEAADFFKGMFETALAPDEVITKVSFPIPEKASYVKFPNPASKFAIVGVFVSRGAGGVRVAVTGAASVVHRATMIEQALAKSFAPSAADGIRIPLEHLAGDVHASAEYRAHLVPVIAKRAIAAA